MYIIDKNGFVVVVVVVMRMICEFFFQGGWLGFFSRKNWLMERFQIYGFLEPQIVHIGLHVPSISYLKKKTMNKNGFVVAVVVVCCCCCDDDNDLRVSSHT
jgi:hypothetical protein